MSDIRINGRMVNFSRLIFQTNDQQKIRSDLENLLGKTGEYDGTLVIIDSTVDNELISLIQLLIDLGLQPMAAIDGKLGEQARTIQFPVLSADQPMQRIKPTEGNTVAAEALVEPVKTAAVETSKPKLKPKSNIIHQEVLRTGQSLSSDDSDIILIADMNSGSELISSASIHIYGTARGRVIAGASGQIHAHIFCQRLEAELVSIAGTYCVADDIPQDKIGKPVHIFLNHKQELEFQTLHH
jgi:septum site-determining protein MinC